MVPSPRHGLRRPGRHRGRVRNPMLCGQGRPSAASRRRAGPASLLRRPTGREPAAGPAHLERRRPRPTAAGARRRDGHGSLGLPPARWLRHLRVPRLLPGRRRPRADGASWATSSIPEGAMGRDASRRRSTGAHSPTWSRTRPRSRRSWRPASSAGRSRRAETSPTTWPSSSATSQRHPRTGAGPAAPRATRPARRSRDLEGVRVQLGVVPCGVDPVPGQVGGVAGSRQADHGRLH
jgi:hypothetical protein